MEETIDGIIYIIHYSRCLIIYRLNERLMTVEDC